MTVRTRSQKQKSPTAAPDPEREASETLVELANSAPVSDSESIGSTDSFSECFEGEEEDPDWITDTDPDDLDQEEAPTPDGALTPSGPSKVVPITKAQVRKIVNIMTKRRILPTLVSGNEPKDPAASTADGDENENDTVEEDAHPLKDVVEDAIEELFDESFAEELKISEEVLKLGSNEEIERTLGDIRRIHGLVKESHPSLLKIINSNLSDKDKAYMVEHFLIYLNKEECSDERIAEKMFINNYIKSKEIKDAEVFKKVTQREKEAEERFNRSVNLKERLYTLNTSDSNMDVIFKMYREYEESQSGNMEIEKEKRDWLDQVSMIPFGKYDQVSLDAFGGSVGDYLVHVRRNLDKHISFMNDIKDELLAMIATMVTNANANIRVIALEGPAGVGKTRLAMKGIAESLGRKFYSISVGTMTDGASIGGDRRVFIGSSPGKILQILMDAQCMNPVILIDELDKVDTTHGGNGIYNALTHLLDPTQSSQFKDSYFSGLTFDLSKILFVISYNDVSRVDHIVGDRIQKFVIPRRTIHEKLVIMQRHLVREILLNTGFKETDLVFPEDVCRRIIGMSKIPEDGCRQLYRNIETVVSRINTLRSAGDKWKDLGLSYSLTDAEIKDLQTLPITVTQSMVENLFWEPKCGGAPPESMYS